VYDGNLRVRAFAAPGAPGAEVDFPFIAAQDDVTLWSDIKVVCRAVVTRGDADRVYPKSDDSPTLFPVGATTVSCVATDEAGNKSPPASFAVEVRCRPNYALNDDGVCTGELGLGDGEGACLRGVGSASCLRKGEGGFHSRRA
jgi:hypothetical protein